MTKAKLEKTLDAIYGGDPAEFIKGRDALAKELRGDGDAAADDVKRLRKPSKPAAVLNALALEQPKPVKKYLGLAEKLRKASSGKVDAAELRTLAREEGELLEELVAEAGKLGVGESATTLNRVRETLQAAQVDSELAEKVIAGRVEREERAASVGLENLIAPPRAARKRTGKAAKSKKDDAATKRETEDKKRDAEAKKKALADAKEAVKEAKAEAREAAREVARAEGALTKAERARDAADEKAERAESKLEKLR